MRKVLEVKTTTESREQAQALAEGIVDSRLAACVQVIGPVTSTYWWNGAVEQSTEWLCVAKTTADLLRPLERFIKERHPYELPEIVATEVVAGNDEYLEWVGRETEGDVRKTS